MTTQIAREETCYRHYVGYSFLLTERVLLYAQSHRQDNAYHGLPKKEFNLKLEIQTDTRSRDGFPSYKPVFHDWSNKGRGMWYPVCRMMHIK